MMTVLYVYEGKEGDVGRRRCWCKSSHAGSHERYILIHVQWDTRGETSLSQC
jgi:hypothetical protein